jgi:hypothetical protein
MGSLYAAKKHGQAHRPSTRGRVSNGIGRLQQRGYQSAALIARQQRTHLPSQIAATPPHAIHDSQGVLWAARARLRMSADAPGAHRRCARSRSGARPPPSRARAAREGLSTVGGSVHYSPFHDVRARWSSRRRACCFATTSAARQLVYTAHFRCPRAAGVHPECRRTVQ